MKAIGYTQTGSITTPGILTEFQAPAATLGSRDMLVEVLGVSMNPVDTKVRVRFEPEGGVPRIMGYDAAGIVQEIGSEVELFAVGDEVFYSGDLTRPGTNAELHAVDERIVGRKPKSLGFPEAAGIPLTAITAWEMLFDSLALEEGGGAGESILIIGGAGGVGSILIQLAKKLTRLQVIATASRPETVEWVEKMGADIVINHHESLVEQLREHDIAPRYVAALTQTEQHFSGIVELIQPRGHIVLIDDPKDFDINSIKPKALSFSWEFMFARSMFGTEDIAVQGELLNRVSQMLDDGELISTVTTDLGVMTVESLIEAHTLQESGTAIGKTVLGGIG